MALSMEMAHTHMIYIIWPELRAGVPLLASTSPSRLTRRSFRMGHGHADDDHLDLQQDLAAQIPAADAAYHAKKELVQELARGLATVTDGLLKGFK